MIDFEFEPAVRAQLKLYHAVAENMMRPISREYDEREHEDPWDYFERMWQAQALTADVSPTPHTARPRAITSSTTIPARRRMQ